MASVAAIRTSAVRRSVASPRSVSSRLGGSASRTARVRSVPRLVSLGTGTSPTAPADNSYLARLEDGPADPGRESVLPPHLVIRGSTGRLRPARADGLRTS